MKHVEHLSTVPARRACARRLVVGSLVAVVLLASAVPSQAAVARAPVVEASALHSGGPAGVQAVRVDAMRPASTALADMPEQGAPVGPVVKTGGGKAADRGLDLGRLLLVVALGTGGLLALVNAVASKPLVAVRRRGRRATDG